MAIEALLGRSRYPVTGRNRLADGRVEVVKVYFKQPQLTPFHAEAMNRLLEYAMPNLPTTGAPVILEARRGKAWNPPAKRNPTMDSYLKSEALSYGSLWQGLAA